MARNPQRSLDDITKWLRETEQDPTEMIYGHSLAQLHHAFEAVQDAENWKNPIDAVIFKKDLEITKLAIHFFTGAPPYKIVETNKEMVRIMAHGYYISCGA